MKTIFNPSKLPDFKRNPIKAITPTKSVISIEEIERFLMKIAHLLEEEQLYLDANLSLKILADKIDLYPNKLSWLLNEQVGKNFNEYINYFGLKAFKQKALVAANSHLTLLGLAYESGFNSKTVFNAFF